MMDSFEPATNYPARYESRMTLKTGREVFLRPVRETDGPLILDLFHRLSADSIFLRFLRPLHQLSPEMLHHLTHLHYPGAFALAALTEETGPDGAPTSAIVAIARYAYEPEERMTELAIAVRDDWQHKGLGKPLLKRLVDIAREHDITRFSGMIDPRNRIIIQILTDLGYQVNYCLKEGIYQVEIQI